MSLKLTFLGSGDAFASGGRMQTAMHVKTSSNNNFLIDCGASIMVGIRKFNIDPNAIQNIFITHLHGDHFGGIPFLILDAQLVSKRVGPLNIFLPKDGTETLLTAMEALFPGSSTSPKKFELIITEVVPEKTYLANEATVTAFHVNHAGLEANALRIQVENKIIAYTGDTDWQDSLIKCAKNADLFISEAYYFNRQVKFHLDLATTIKHLNQMNIKRHVLTHMSSEMLEKLNFELQTYDCAYDGKVIEIT